MSKKLGGNPFNVESTGAEEFVNSLVRDQLILAGHKPKKRTAKPAPVFKQKKVVKPARVKQKLRVSRPVPEKKEKVAEVKPVAKVEITPKAPVKAKIARPAPLLRHRRERPVRTRKKLGESTPAPEEQKPVIEPETVAKIEVTPKVPEKKAEPIYYRKKERGRYGAPARKRKRLGVD